MARKRLDVVWGVPEAAFEQDRLDRERGRVRMLNGSLEGGMEDWTMAVEQYELVRALILEILEDFADDDATVVLKDVVAIAQDRLGDHPAFPGGRLENFTSYTKVDLEARGLIQRVPKSSPQRLQLRQPDPPTPSPSRGASTNVPSSTSTCHYGGNFPEQFGHRGQVSTRWQSSS